MMNFLRLIIQLRVYRGGKEEEGEGEGERMHEWGLESERGWKSKVGLPPAS
jgi:hypothetical protein